jgi:hypothetical protein
MIKLKKLLNEETFTATNKKTGNTSVFKSKEHRDSAIKAGTHTAIKDKSQSTKSTGSSSNGNIFGKPKKLEPKSTSTSTPAKKVNHISDALPKEIYAKMDNEDSDAGEMDYLSTKDGAIKYGIAKEGDKYYVTLGTEEGEIIKSFGKTKDAGEAVQIFMKNLDMVKSKVKLDM